MTQERDEERENPGPAPASASSPSPASSPAPARTSSPAPARTSRRRLLKTGLLGGALLALGGTGLALYPSRQVGAPTSPLACLTPRSFQVLVAVASRVVSAKGADPVAVAHGVDRALAYALPETQAEVDTLLGLFENALPGLLLDGRVLPFTRLSATSQDSVLESWRTSRITVRRVGYQALRRLVLAAYYMEESSWGALGYAPPSGLNAMAYDDSEVGTPAWLRARVEGDAP
jgi:hypothetical protein